MVPAGSEFTKARDDDPARLPGSQDQPEQTSAQRTDAPRADTLDAIDRDTRTTAAQPELGTPAANLGGSPDTSLAPVVAETGADDPVLPNPLAQAPDAPGIEPRPEAATTPATPPRAEPGEKVSGFPTDDLTQAATGPAPVTGPQDQALPTPPAEPQNAATGTTASRQTAFGQTSTASTGRDTGGTGDNGPAGTTPDSLALAQGETDLGRGGRDTAASIATQVPTVSAAVSSAVSAEGSTNDAAQLPQSTAQGTTNQGTTNQSTTDIETRAPASGAPGTQTTVAQPEATAQGAAGSGMPGTRAVPLTERTNPTDAASATQNPNTSRTAPANAPADAPAIGGTGTVTTAASATHSAETRAIISNGERFDNPEAKPLVAIVLIDQGGDTAGLAALKSFPYPITFAINPEAPEAKTRMQTYRAAGHEVAAMVSLPPNATPQDVETAAAVWFDTLPAAVAVMESPDKSLQSGREVSEQLADILTTSGHGLLLYPNGLDTGRKLAERQGVPAASIFRDLDAQDQGAAVIRRFLDNAAFRAGQQGTVVMVGRMRAETISALLLWGLAERADRVALAPLSAALTATLSPDGAASDN